MANLQNHSTDNYSLEIRDHLAVLRLIGKVYELSTSLGVKKDYMGLLASLDESPDVHAVLMLCPSGALGHDGFRAFLAEAGAQGKAKSVPGGGAMSNAVHRFKNGLNHFIGTATGFRKILVIGLEGDVASPFFGVSLAADYLFASRDMTFAPSHIELGEMPGGSLLPFPQSVDARTIRDLLFATAPTDAAELLRRGLIDDCLPTEGFDAACVQRAEALAQLPLAPILGIKALMHSHERSA